MSPLVTTIAGFALCVAPAAAQTEFGVEDLKALVAELEPHVPQNPWLAYPIDISIVEDEDINAYATARLEEGSEKPRAIMVFHTGIILAANGDKDILRGVAAHELAHLSQGHMFGDPNEPSDLSHHRTRQQEHEADVLGADFLEKAGHARDGMLATLLFLDRVTIDEGTQWFGQVAGDHASAVMRAALLRGDDKAYRAVARFEMGTAFLQCRRYRRALQLFDEAVAIEPRLVEARVNAVVAALEDYYDQLPESVQEAWLLPAFDVHLTQTRLLRGRSIELTPEDLVRYQEVLRRIELVPHGASPQVMSFLRGTAGVLHPKGERELMELGVSVLTKALGVQGDNVVEGPLRLRFANNRALGLARLGDNAAAARALLDEQLACNWYVHEVAANLARFPLEGLDKANATTLILVLAHHLRNTPPQASAAARARAAFERVQKAYGLSFNGSIEPPPVYYCQVTSAIVGGQEVQLFDPLDEVIEMLGEKLGEGAFDEHYPDLVWTVHGDLDVILFGERDEVVKVTTYREGDSVELVPLRATGVTAHQVVRVGMTCAEFDAVLATAGGERLLTKPLPLVGRWCFQPVAEGEAPMVEFWDYYPSLNIGVLMVDDRVAGLSVTPVKADWSK